MASPSTTALSEAVAGLKAELQRRQAVVDDAFAELDVACRELEEMRTLLVGLVGAVDAEVAPSLDHRRGPKGELVTWDGKTLSIWQWSQLTGIRANTIYMRLKRGWSPARALTEKEHAKTPPTADSQQAVPPPEESAPVSRPREDMVLDLANEGKSARQIADQLETSLQTVYVHLASLRRQGKLPYAKESPPPPSPVEPPPRSPAPPPSAISIPRPDVKPQEQGSEVMVVLPAKPEPSEPDPESANKPQDLDALKAKVRALQGGNKQKPVALVTTRANKHAHTAKVDFFGDGQTDVDSSGHVHPVRQFVIGKAHGHFHDFVLPG